ncbi:MAG: translation initiation factor IF-3 [Patescibacteria group bacterium]|nr:translation initiation factor IF-3 [Patescibacteria group bacterium]
MRISRKRYKKPVNIEPQYFYNEKIRVPEIMVIAEDGQNLGVMPTHEAIRIAAERELDVVEVNPKAVPPIAKIMDYGQFKYQKEKEFRKLRAGAHRVEVKGIRLSVRISDHDLAIRCEQAKKFLDSGDRVKIEILLRGREKQHPELAFEQVSEFINQLSNVIKLKIEQPATRQGGMVTALVTKT